VSSEIVTIGAIATAQAKTVAAHACARERLAHHAIFGTEVRRVSGTVGAMRVFCVMTAAVPR
jgi:hypothetical protein